MTLGSNTHYTIVPNDIATKPNNLYARGILTEKALADIDVSPNDTTNVSPDVLELFNAAPGFVKQLRSRKTYRNKVKEELAIWKNENPIYVSSDGLLEYITITLDSFSHGVACHGRYYKRSGGTTRLLNNMELSNFLIDKA